MSLGLAPILALPRNQSTVGCWIPTEPIIRELVRILNSILVLPAARMDS